jgi:hypothetical protein
MTPPASTIELLQRSACARAFGARTGALMTLMPSERKTSSKSRLNCQQSPVSLRELRPSDLRLQYPQLVARKQDLDLLLPL